MKKFKFRLERVQRLRERVREQKKLELAEAVQYSVRVEGQITQLNEVRNQELDELRRHLSDPQISITDAIAARTYDHLLVRHEHRLEQQLDQIQGVVRQRRHQLMEAEKGVRILEKLEERLHQRHQASVDAADRQLMDELATVADQRRRLGGLGPAEG